MAFPGSSHLSSRMNARLGRSSARKYWFTGVALGVIGVTAASFVLAKDTKPESLVIALDLSHPPPEVVAPSLFNLSALMKLSHYDTLRTLDYAASDRHVQGIVANLSFKESWSMSQAQEMREAINRFKSSGKYAYCFADTFGELGESNTNYFLACGFDRIYLQPCGDVNLLGYQIHAPFLRELLDRLGIQPQFVQRKEYKNAANMFMEKKFTPAHKESMNSILTSIYSALVTGISQGRKLPTEQVEQIIADGPYTATQAQQAGLVDDLIYENEIIPLLKSGGIEQTAINQHQLTHKPDPIVPSTTLKSLDSPAVIGLLNPYLTRVVRFESYAHKALLKLDKRERSAKLAGAPKIALLYGIGTCTTVAPQSAFSGAHFHSSTLAKAIHNASLDPTVVAILFRIDSPGGSYVAADTVHAALLEAKNAGKKVIVSMGSLAASGGYFAAAPADYILANPSTLTGSIGVFGGKFALRNFLENKIGITFDGIRVGGGETSGMFGQLEPWNLAQLKKMNELMDRIYGDFVGKVASGRHMKIETAEALAKGRVWTGEEALRNGLVDELGGLYQSIQKAKELCSPYALVEVIPRKRSLIQMIREVMETGDAEKDDEPLFNSSVSTSLASTLIGSSLKDGLGMMEAQLMKDFMSYMGIHTGTGIGGLNIDATDGILGETGIVDTHGKLKL